MASSSLVTAARSKLKTSTWLIRELTESGIHVELSSTLRGHRVEAADRAAARALPGRLHRAGESPRLAGRREADDRRDRSVRGLVLGLPVLLSSRMPIKLDSPGPVVFPDRVGRNGSRSRCPSSARWCVDAEARQTELPH